VKLDTPSPPQELYAAQVRLLYSQGPIALVATVLNSTIVVLVLQTVLPSSRLLTWLALIWATAAVRFVLAQRYTKGFECRHAVRLGRVAIAGVLISGVLWGSAAVFLFPEEPALQIFLAFVLGGMVAGAAAAYSALKTAFMAYSIPALAPIVVRFFMLTDSTHFAMGVLTLLFGLLITISSFRVHGALVSSLYLGFENTGLVRFLSDARDQAERLNEELLAQIRQRENFELELKKRQEKLRELLAHLEGVREDERKHIAREVHDGLGQILTSAAYELASLRKSVATEEVGQRIEGVLQMIAGMREEVRAIARKLRPPILDDLGLKAAVEWFLDDFQKRTGIACSLQVMMDDININEECATAVFRTLQESLTNVVRHAGAKRVKVSLGLEHGSLLYLEVTDDGKGIDLEQMPKIAFGLIGMRERAIRLSGELTVEKKEAAGGTRVLLRIPIDSCDPEIPEVAGPAAGEL
jgi:signal transduction histidine kinase